MSILDALVAVLATFCSQIGDNLDILSALLNFLSKLLDLRASLLKGSANKHRKQSTRKGKRTKKPRH